MAAESKPDLLIDEFLAQTRALNGTEIPGRTAWHECATAEAIRHFCYGTSDPNPLWLDPDYAANTRHQTLLAPPAFLASVRYPVRHGAALGKGLSSLIAELEFTWHERICLGDRLDATARQNDVFDGHDRFGRRAVYVLGETVYRNQDQATVATARATLARVDHQPGELVMDRKIHHYSTSELDRISAALNAEAPNGIASPDPETLRAGDRVAQIVRGPLSIGDMITWHAAIGPPYRSGILAYRDNLAEPNMAVTNPATGWMVRKSQQHEDSLLAAQRGMPAPFDNGVMRFAWVAPLLTNWMGDEGFLERLRLSFDQPALYGDATWYTATVISCQIQPTGARVRLEITGTNQIGQINTRGEATVWLPPARIEPTTQRLTPNLMASQSEAAHAPDPSSMVDAWSDRRPDQAALTFGDQTLNYRELRERTSALARHFIAEGVNAGDLVALYLDRDLNLIIAKVALMKIGAAYLPLDITDPIERVHRQLDRAGNPRVFATESTARGLGRLTSDAIWLPKFDLASQVNSIDLPVGPWNSQLPAYVLFTSGSTGEPKGVVVSRGALGRYLSDLAKRLPITEGDLYAHTASPAFSAGVRQTWLPLSQGATVVLTGKECRRDPLALWREMHRSGVTVWDTVPSYWAVALELLSSAPATDQPTLQTILLTGEPLPWKLTNDWRPHLPSTCRIFNLYSQTETTGTAAMFEVPADSPTPTGTVPVGQAFGSARIVLLNDQRQLVAEGEGELYVGGNRLADGYLHNPELTAERFILDPADGQTRLYRTGDRARLDAQGQIHYIDRTDRRIRVRGQRVELGETEHAMRQLPGVSDCVAVATTDALGETRLVAFVRSTSGEALESQALRDRVQDVLPAAAVPSWVRQITDFPRSPSGKLDRPALLRTLNQAPTLPESAATDTNTTETTLMEIWRQVLGLESVGLRDDFFELGGSSIAAVRAFAQIGRQFGRHLPLSILYDTPTIEALANAIDSTSGEQPPELNSLVRISKGAIGKPLFLVHGIAGNVLFYRGLAERLASAAMVYALQPVSLDGKRHRPETIEQMAHRYVTEIRRIQPQGPYWLGGFSLGGLIAYEMAQQLLRDGETVELLAILDSHAPAGQSSPSRPHHIQRPPSRLKIRRGWRHRWVVRRKQILAMIRKVQWQFCFMLGKPLPAGLRPYYVAQLASSARSCYRAQPYAGNLVLFCTKSRRPHSEPSWHALCEGRLTCIDVPGQHKGMFLPENVPELAEALKSQLPAQQHSSPLDFQESGQGGNATGTL